MHSGLLHRAKQLSLGAMSALSGRHAVLLPAEARADDMILDLRAPYRVNDALVVELLPLDDGSLSATLLAQRGFSPDTVLWRGTRPYHGPARLRLEVDTGRILLGDEVWGRVPVPLPTRRFSWQLELRGRARSMRRLTGHYVAGHGSEPDESYYHGDDYVDYEAQSAGEPALVLDLFDRFRGSGPVLDVGCATGGVIAALRAHGLEAIGCDVSDWAVNRARERLGRDAAYVWNAETQDVPAAIAGAAPFGALVLWAVLEHFADPPAVLDRLSRLVAPGGLLLINTCNAGSLCHYLFGSDWEGYYDRTHHGADRVSVTALQQWLPRSGWNIESLTTHMIWDGSADPTRACLRDMYASDARFRRLLRERDAGDLIVCAARRSG